MAKEKQKQGWATSLGFQDGAYSFGEVITILKSSIREYKKFSVITPVLVTAEVVIECALPFLIFNLCKICASSCRNKRIIRHLDIKYLGT